MKALAAILALTVTIAVPDLASSDTGRLVGAGETDRLANITSVEDVPAPFVTPEDPDRLRSIATEILDSPRYQAPTESAFDRFLAQAQAWLAEAIGRLVTALGGARNAGLLALVLVTAAGIAGFAFLARRRTASVERTTRLERILAEGGDPAELERAAASADRESRHADAIRLRFVAGLLRLDMAGRITFRPGLTTGAVVEALGDERFTRLARQFEEIAYGGRPATETMSIEAAEGWRSVLSEEAVVS